MPTETFNAADPAGLVEYDGMVGSVCEIKSLGSGPQSVSTYELDENGEMLIDIPIEKYVSHGMVENSGSGQSAVSVQSQGNGMLFKAEAGAEAAGSMITVTTLI